MVRLPMLTYAKKPNKDERSRLERNRVTMFGWAANTKRLHLAMTVCSDGPYEESTHSEASGARVGPRIYAGDNTPKTN